MCPISAQARRSDVDAGGLSQIGGLINAVFAFWYHGIRWSAIAQIRAAGGDDDDG